MPTVRDILTQKNTGTFTVGSDATVVEAAELMNEHKIGCLLVTEGDQLKGIFTERDVLRQVVGKRIDPAEITVGQVMTKEVVCCGPDTKVAEAQAVMKNRRIRHLPVVDEKEGLVGMISIGDLNAFHANSQEVTIHYLHEYLYGRT